MTAPVPRAPHPVTRALRTWWPSAAFFVAVVAGWELWVSARHVQTFVMPTPARTVGAAYAARHVLLAPLGTTVYEAAVGLVLGAVVGVAFALLVVRFDLARRAVYPLLAISQTIPIIVLAPLLVLWFGFTLTPRIVVVVLIVFFPVLVSTVSAVDAVDRDLVDLVRSMGASRRQVLRTVLLPAAVPGFFAGLRIAAAYAIGGAVIAEFVGGNSGLGVLMTDASKNFLIDRVIAIVAIVALLTAVLFVLVGVAERLAAPWQAVDRADRGRDHVAGGSTAPARGSW